MRLGFIGTGEITSSIVTGLKSVGAGEHSISLSPRNHAVASRLADHFHGVSVRSSNQDVLDQSDTVVIAVRPLAVREVLSELRFRDDHHVISLVSGLSLARVKELVFPARQFVRAVPLPSTAKRLGPTAIYPSNPSALEVFGAVGTAFAVELEGEFEAICATTATMAFYFAFNQTIAAWLEQRGIPASQARDYVARLFFGVASTAVDKPDRSFQSLARAHATPGGTNEQFLNQLVQDGVLTNVSEALDAILRRISS